MSRLDDLKPIANECLDGLKADRGRLHAILNGSVAQKPRRLRAVPILATCAALALVLAIAIPALRQPNAPIGPTVMTLGQETPGAGEMRALDMPAGSVSVSGQGAVPGYQSLWATGPGKHPPLVRVDGRYYRLLKSSVRIGDGQLTGGLGTVSMNTDEPALETSGSVVSNALAEGTEVYGVSGMDGTAVAARVDGALRVFQRFSFAGEAMRAGESLADTLRGQVVSLELSGVGRVSDAGRARDLMGILTSSASYKNAGVKTTKQSLLIHYDNGVSLMMSVSQDQLMGCGAWVCPAFFEAFSQ